MRGGGYSTWNDYKKDIKGAGYREFENGKTINIYYRGRRKFYDNKKYPQYGPDTNQAGITGHQGWRKKDVKRWIPKLRAEVNKKK